MPAEALTPAAEAMGADVEGVFTKISANVLLRRIAPASEISGIWVYPASEDSSSMTGAYSGSPKTHAPQVERESPCLFAKSDG